MLFYTYTCGMGNARDNKLDELMIDVKDVDDYARMSGRSAADFLNMVKGTGVMPIDTGVEKEALTPRATFLERLTELGMYGDLSKKRYFKIKKLYNSADWETANMACKIVAGLHAEMIE
jgi:hypothetical protein